MILTMKIKNLQQKNGASLTVKQKAIIQTKMKSNF